MEQDSELLAGDQAGIGGLTPNRAPPSLLPIASGPSRPKRSVESSLNLLANTMAHLTGQMLKVQQQVADLQAEKANKSWAQMEHFAQAKEPNIVSPVTVNCVRTARPAAGEPTIETIHSYVPLMLTAADRHAATCKNKVI